MLLPSTLTRQRSQSCQLMPRNYKALSVVLMIAAQELQSASEVLTSDCSDTSQAAEPVTSHP